MAFEKAKEYLESRGFGDRIKVFDVSSATVLLAAAALGTAPAHIAKSMTFKVNGKPVMVICAGDTKVDNHKFKEFFGTKATMLSFDEVHSLIGHDVGGVCPFGINEGVAVYADISLKRFENVYPACGSSNSAVCLTVDELFTLSGAEEYIDVCKLKEETN